MYNEEPLNPQLFRGLERYYGAGNVEIVNAGREIDWRLTWEKRLGSLERVAKRQIIQGGEEYRVRCKLCRDWKPRLHINHRWGVWDEDTKSKNLWLANCFNEGCYSEFEDQQLLFECIYAINRHSRTKVSILPGRPNDTQELREVPPAGLMWTMEHLKNKHPGHPAVVYLESRGYDVIKLSRLWKIGYCADSRYEQARNRIIIPIHFDGMLVGWQARYIGDDFVGVPFKKAGVEKYWTSPGFQKRLVGYNAERALRHPTVVVVEGPTDAWRVGPMAMAVLGKTISPQLRELIAEGMQQHGDRGVVAVAFDADPLKRSNGRTELHPTVKAVAQLRPLMAKVGTKVVAVPLPPGSDPGDMERAELRRIIRAAAASAGAIAEFRKPSPQTNHTS